MQSFLEPVAGNLFDIASLLIAAGALIFSALAFRIAKQALVAAERSDLAALKLKAQEGRARAERSTCHCKRLATKCAASGIFIMIDTFLSWEAQAFLEMTLTTFWRSKAKAANCSDHLN